MYKAPFRQWTHNTNTAKDSGTCR